MSDTEEPAAEGFSEQERAAMKARAKELKTESRGGRGGKKAAADEAAVLKTIAEMAAPDAAVAARLHAIITETAPELAPKLWYAQPAYAKNGKVVCFFRSGQLDKERYSSLGFTAEANLDAPGGIWATAYAVSELSEDGEKLVRKLVAQAVS